MVTSQRDGLSHKNQLQLAFHADSKIKSWTEMCQHLDCKNETLSLKIKNQEGLQEQTERFVSCYKLSALRCNSLL